MLGAFQSSGGDGMAALAAAAFPLDHIDTKRNYNRDFQKAEVLRYLVRREPLTQMHQPLTISPDLFEVGCEEGYLVFLYNAEEHEYEEGFGPSVNVRIGLDETTWKRSRNKWNPFEKIKTVPGMESSNDFKIVWDRAHSNSFYVTERMYYYLDREKHRDKFRNLRAKLYITRLLQRTGQSFLLQFIIERAQEEEYEPLKVARESLRPVSRYANDTGSSHSPHPARPVHPSTNSSHANGSPRSNGSNGSHGTPPDVPSPRTSAMLSAFSKTHLSMPTTLQPAAASSSSTSPVFGQAYGATLAPHALNGASGINPALLDHFGGQSFDGSRIQSYPPMTMFTAPRFYPGMVAAPSTPQMTLSGTPGVLRPLAGDGAGLAHLQHLQQVQMQQLLAQQALELHQQQMFRQQFSQQPMAYAAPISHFTPTYKSTLGPQVAPHGKSRSLGESDATSWRSESGQMKRLNDTTTSDLPETASKRRSTEVPDYSLTPHMLNLAALSESSYAPTSSGATTPSTASSTASYSSAADRMFES